MAVFVGGKGVDVAEDLYDVMYGDAGNDKLTSTLDAAGLIVTILGGDGNDTLDLYGSDSYAVIFGEAGNDDIDGASAFDQLYGGSGKDFITGFTGGDELRGGDGNDYLYGYSDFDIDLGTEKDSLFGGSGKDQLFGQGGNDVLRGGTGKDILWGDAGSDEFWFDTKLNAKTNVDQLPDFANQGDDVFRLAVSVFKALPVEDDLPAEMFHVGKKAADGDDHIIYNQSTGVVYYDPDGKGGKDQIAFAELGLRPTLTEADFFGSSG